MLSIVYSFLEYMMDIKMSMYIWLYILLTSEGIHGITTHSVTGCSNMVNLSCSGFEMIHVERITYYNGNDCNQTLIDQQVCGIPLTGSNAGLSPSCNGKILCNENLHYTYCPGSKAAKIDYRCIQGEKDMCDKITINNTNRIFLSTPNYPSSPTFKGVSSCRCHILGTNITSIDILDLELTSADDGTKSNLEINYGDVTYRKESLNGTTRRVYNKRFTSTATKAEIILNHNNINQQYLWIEIQGFNMRMLCNVIQSTMTPTSTTPPQERTSIKKITSSTDFVKKAKSDTPRKLPSTDEASSFTSTRPLLSSNCKCSEFLNQRSDSNKDTTIIVLAVLLTLCLLIGCVTTIAVFILLRRKNLVWMKKPPQDVGERNHYNGLDLTHRVAESDRPYQDLDIRNSTPQYINISQTTHPEYQNLN